MLASFSVRSLTLRAIFLASVTLTLSAVSPAQFRVAITFGPPALPVYEQPVCPGEGYIWTPGYWYWDDDDEDYYWVPGTWVLAPEVGFLWTPGWWGWGGEAFAWHEGFWGPEVGFYGGVAYGFGYFGEGYEGGRWEGGHFLYNRAVNNVDVTIVHNVYNTTVINNNTTINRVSYNGPGGVQRQPTPREQAAMQVRHLPPAQVQTQHVQAARSNRELHASVNQGRPAIAATQKPGDFRGHVVSAKAAGAPYHPPANRGAAARPGNQPGRPENNPPGNNASRGGNYVHPKELPPAQRLPAPNTGNAKQDQKYQQQQEKMYAKQEQDRQKLQQKQDQEHQKYAQQQANAARTQQLEQRHQQQTQQLQQRHEAQQQQMQQRTQPAHESGGRPKGK